MKELRELWRTSWSHLGTHSVFTERRNQLTNPRSSSPSPHPLVWELARPGLGDLCYSAQTVTACKSVCCFRKCITFLGTLGRGRPRSQQKRHLFPRTVFLGSVTNCPHCREDCSPLCLAARQSRRFARRDAQLPATRLPLLAAAQLGAWPKTEANRVPKSVGSC